MKSLKSIIGIICLLLIGNSCNTSKTNTISPVINWAKEHSTEIRTPDLSNQQKDLEPLKQIIGDAELVCLGESRHDIREQFQLKNRFVKYMVEKLGFTAFAIEGSLPYAHLINEYILSGSGDVEHVMANMPGWFLWDTEEISDLIVWMRDYNRKPEHKKKIQFYGIDIVAPNYALDQIFAYLQKVDEPIVFRFQERSFARDHIDDNNWPSTLQAYAGMSEEEKLLLSTNYRELYEHLEQNKTQYIANSSEEAYDWILRLAYCAREANSMFSAEERIDVGLIRDNAMAQNILWLKQSLPADEKIIVWAHNVHIAKAEFTMSTEPDRIKGMGYLLHQALQDKMVSIGASFNQGEFSEWDRSFPPAEEHTVDGVLAKVNQPYFLLNLKGETETQEVISWLNTEQVMRGQDFEMVTIPAKAFDALYFVNTISRTIPNQQSAERFRR